VDFVSAGAFFLACLVATFFFFADFAAGAFVDEDGVGDVVTFVVSGGGNPIGGGFVTGCDSKLVESIKPSTSQ
jgi:hypothetical protein